MSRASGTPINLYDEREVMEEFISCYRHFTALWDSSSEDYLSKQKKEPGYRELLNILQRINGDATVNDVKRKINSLRCCYRRQIKKVQASQNGYKPRLWWYHLMDFLNPVLNIQSPLRMKSDSLDDSLDETSINDDDIFAETFNKEEDVLGGMEPGSEGEAEPEPYLDTEADADPDLATEPIISGRHRTDAKGITNDFHDSTSNRSRSGSREGHDLDKSSRSNMRRVRTRRRSSNNASDYEESSRKPQGKRQRIKEDPSPDRNRDRVIDRDSDSECELIGKRMAAHFRNMRTDQRLFAERIISEVLVFGRMNRLSFDSQFIPNRKED
ncbi:uncharacterized protein LOC110180573 [Drosophila serrata]|uniref:uncharacterized protein LOC110180573 n=1 Tax=Drosophila serrata TaxID=7274 RepID=UPI000A1D2423|nr:uncharacterized protein LOC110180573 [Drosophila serrata]